jgi:hypothetical protein
MAKPPKKPAVAPVHPLVEGSLVKKRIPFFAEMAGWGNVLNLIPYYGFWLLLIYMPFHIFLSQSLSLVTGGLEAWKIGKDVFLALLVLFAFCSVVVQRRATRIFWGLSIFVGVYTGLHGLLWLAHPDLYDKSALLGTIYNSRLPVFLLLGYSTALLNPSKFVFSSLIKIVLGVSTLVAALGILQYVLPKDLLMHVGYSLERGARPAFFIDDRPDLPRIMATLREPNALGAYLILPATALLALLFKVRAMVKRYVLVGALGVHLAAIFLTHSRSAWLATLLAVGLVGWWQYYKGVLRMFKRFWPLVVAGLLLLAVAGWTQRNSVFFQQYIIHSNPDEQVQDLDSNDYHWLLVKQGVEGIANQPFGHGPGTAGLVSIQNPDGGQLTENYYIQIGYELGIIGLVLFVALNVWVYMRLRTRHDTLGVVLCASFWAYVLTNMLLHTWSNEAVAAQWWLLAGVALLLPVMQAQRAEK